MFRRLKARVTGGGTTVETTLREADVHPGGTVDGEIHIVGGDVEQDISFLQVSIAARVEVETDEGEHETTIEVAQHRVTDQWALAPGDEHRFPFSLTVPVETPFNVFRGEPLPGIRIGLRTELEIARSVDRGDLDPLRIHPLPAQEAVMDALLGLGFTFKRADLERGTIHGSTLPFFQEIELAPSRQYRGQLNELEVTFLARHGETEVILEADKRGGLLSEGRDAFRRFTIGDAELGRLDVTGLLEHELQEIARRRGIFG
jgi:sporulation-control protein